MGDHTRLPILAAATLLAAWAALPLHAQTATPAGAPAAPAPAPPSEVLPPAPGAAATPAVPASPAAPSAPYVSDGSDLLPEEKKSGDISYRSGGAGDDEEHALLAAGRKLGLTLKFYITVQGKGAFASDVQVDISRAGGASVFSATSEGPYMIVDLPPGSYKVSATLHGATKTQQVQIGKHDHRIASFHWIAASED